MSSSRGLASAEARERLARHGPNAIEAGRRRPPWRMVVDQLTDFMIVVLLVAAAISGVVGEAQDAIAILVIVVLNAAIGAVQEYRAERAVAALRRLAAPSARVLRDGVASDLPATEVVPGDIVLLEAGRAVPTDLRLLEAIDLRVDEAALTGESHPAQKLTEPLAQVDLALGDRHNMAYKGTLVTSGRGGGVAVATGMDTELGRIATLLEAQEAAKTPLQKRLARFGQRLAVAVLGICAIIFLAGVLRGEPLVLMFLTSVSLAVAAIPEALPAVVTVSLALGARKMSQRHALIRRLPAVETLGSVTYICSDKTGTLTENSMRLEVLFADGRQATGQGLAQPATQPWARLGQALALSNDAEPAADVGLRGDPTEVALYLAARDAGYVKQELEQERPRIDEIPFDTSRKRMTTVHREDGGFIAFTKGAPEAVLPICRDELGPEGIRALNTDNLLQRAHDLAAHGYRVLGLAYRRFDALPQTIEAQRMERDLTFLGLAALIDPPRQEVPEAVKDCRSAGIVPVMITGDHPATALAIAARLGIAAQGETVMTGEDLARTASEDFSRRVADIPVYARVTPEQKIRIVEALQTERQFVAMTGDGVNDAPALKRADIGVAMGLKGTDVAREAADMVLLDDNFATIVHAVREGRRIYDNIRKFVKYTMTSNAGEIWTLFLAPFLGLPIPLLPIQILWINLVTDGLPGLALTAEPEEKGIMRRPPRAPEESIFAHGVWQHIIWAGVLIGGLSILAQAWSYQSGSEHWQTMVFTVLTLCQLAHVLAIRSDRESLLSIGLASNLPLLGAVMLTLGLQLAVIYVPLFNGIFRTQPLTAGELAVCLTLPLVVLVAVEIEKTLVRGGWIYQSVPPNG